MSGKLTKAQRRNLELVRDGKVFRVYRANGNVIKGGHPFTVRGLEDQRLVTEGIDRSRPGMTAYIELVLTDAGRRALTAAGPSRNGGGG